MVYRNYSSALFSALLVVGMSISTHLNGMNDELRAAHCARLAREQARLGITNTTNTQDVAYLAEQAERAVQAGVGSANDGGQAATNTPPAYDELPSYDNPPAYIEQFLANHPAALALVQALNANNQSAAMQLFNTHRATYIALFDENFTDILRANIADNNLPQALNDVTVFIEQQNGIHTENAQLIAQLQNEKDERVAAERRAQEALRNRENRRRLERRTNREEPNEHIQMRDNLRITDAAQRATWTAQQILQEDTALNLEPVARREERPIYVRYTQAALRRQQEIANYEHEIAHENNRIAQIPAERNRLEEHQARITSRLEHLERNTPELVHDIRIATEELAGCVERINNIDQESAERTADLVRLNQIHTALQSERQTLLHAIYRTYQAETNLSAQARNIRARLRARHEPSPDGPLRETVGWIELFDNHNAATFRAIEATANALRPFMYQTFNQLEGERLYPILIEHLQDPQRTDRQTAERLENYYSDETFNNRLTQDQLILVGNTILARRGAQFDEAIPLYIRFAQAAIDGRIIPDYNSQRRLENRLLLRAAQATYHHAGEALSWRAQRIRNRINYHYPGILTMEYRIRLEAEQWQQSPMWLFVPTVTLERTAIATATVCAAWLISKIWRG